MTTLTGGPAAGQTLMIRRTPIFLRVVEQVKGRLKLGGTKWDALDQLEDEPRWNEVVHVYRLVKRGGHVCIRQAKGGGCFQICEYAYLEPQPPADVLRFNSRWRDWCMAESRKEPAQ